MTGVVISAREMTFVTNVVKLFSERVCLRPLEEEEVRPMA
jgi:hypothetical protein